MRPPRWRPRAATTGAWRAPTRVGRSPRWPERSVGGSRSPGTTQSARIGRLRAPRTFAARPRSSPPPPSSSWSPSWGSWRADVRARRAPFGQERLRTAARRRSGGDVPRRGRIARAARRRLDRKRDEVTSLEERTRANAITGETVLRSPRLAVVAPPGDEPLVMELVGALVRWLRAWHVPVVLYTDTPGDTTETPWSSVRQRPLAEIEGIVGGGVRTETDEQAVRNGGDVTLLVSPGDPSAELVLESAAATETPVILVVSPGAPAAVVERFVRDAEALHEGLAFAGYVTIGDGAPSAGLGLAPLGGVPRIAAGEAVPAEPEDPIEALDEYRDPPGAEDGWRLDLRALLRVGSRAPAFLRRDAAAAPSIRRPRAARPGSSTRRGRALMVQGTHSSAGKSFLATALARYFSNLGLRVAPFKGQNMSNNSRVCRGGEMGVAQYLQAFAARAEPD